MKSIDTTACKGWLATCVLLASSFCVANAQTSWESEIRKNTPTNIELASIQEEGTRIVIRGTANSNPDIAEYMRTLLENVAEPSLLQITREADKSVFVLTIKNTKQQGNGE